MMSPLRWPCGLLIGFVLAAQATAADPVQFNRDIRPILSDNCFYCHGPDPKHREADLRLDIREEALAMEAFVPGKPDASALIDRILTTDEDDLMPPPDSHKKLTPAQKDLFKRWVAEGAEYQQHWSFEPLNPVKVPPVKNASWVKNPIDAFVLAGLEKKGLAPSPAADAVTLARRLSFDLTGLPPTAEDVATLPDRIPEVLKSVRHAERLTTWWLDLVRYGDTLGYHGDQAQSVSPYRDYVIRSFHENKPFDQFTHENLAGDLLPHSGLWEKVASTYNRLNRTSGEGGAQPKEYQAKYDADRVRTTGAVWLGLTTGCAECHDHKFDPFTTRDFYSFAAFFADIKEQGVVKSAVHIAQLPVPTPEQAARKDGLETAIAALVKDFARVTPEIQSAFDQWRKAAADALQQWQPLKLSKATTSAGGPLQIGEDGHVLATGENPDTVTYTLTANSPLKTITALRIELPPSDKLPAKGPGRAGNGNFVLNGVTLASGENAAKFATATATHSQIQHSPDYLISGHKNGWAILPEAGKPHELVLTLTQPLEVDASGQVTVSLVHSFGKAHNLGSFRLHVTDAALPAPASDLPSTDVVALLRQKASPQNLEQLRNAFRARTPLLADQRDGLAKLRGELDALNKQIVTTLATTAVEPRTIRILPRGDWMKDDGEIVEPAVPAFLPASAVPKDKPRLDRLDLARWMTSKENPLVARTFVNRLWMLFFGHGLARNVDDLGSQGEPPSHAELLDWLALEFIDSGWDVRHLVGLMVNSNTYRQSSSPRTELAETDPSNHLLARQNSWRIDAEMVRDSALKIGGLLVEETGGVSVKPYQPEGYWDNLNFPRRTYQASTGPDQYRRGLYTWWQRSYVHPSLLAFDAPTREECTAQRLRSNIPQQALVLLNDPTYVEAARAFAARVLAECNGNETARITWAFQEALQRKPSADELKTLTDLLIHHRAEYAQEAEAAKALLATGQSPMPDKVDPVELASWTHVTRVLLNLHETITRS